MNEEDHDRVMKLAVIWRYGSLGASAAHEQIGVG